MAQAARICGVRRSRYVGQARTHLQRVNAVSTITIFYITVWLVDEIPAKTRISPFAALMAMVRLPDAIPIPTCHQYQPR